MTVLNPRTNEIMETAEAVLEFEPLNPVELEFIIRELSDRLEASVPVLKNLWEARYKAEKDYISVKAKALLASTAVSVAEKRAESEIASLPQLADFQAAKTTLHAAEELQKALQAKLYGYLNLNKSVAAAYNSAGVAR